MGESMELNAYLQEFGNNFVKKLKTALLIEQKQLPRMIIFFGFDLLSKIRQGNSQEPDALTLISSG
jgi:hypothetical protein